MAQYQYLTRYKHLMAIGYIFAYNKNHAGPKIVFDPMDPYFNDKVFVEEYWVELYHDKVEPIITNVPEIRRREMQLSMFADKINSANIVIQILYSSL